jgi:light-regulated signal transduction histidine kinase (bacteriophytochrome)
MEYRLRRHDGVYRWLFDNGVPRYSLGESFQGFIGSCVDITEMKEANDAVLASQKILVAKTRELERSNAELEQFAYVASHDLQEPLRMVVCYMELLERDYKGRLEDKADKFIQYAIDGAHRMKQLIDDLLAYSRIGTLGRPFERVDSGEVVRRAITALSLAIEEANAEIVVGEMPTLVADPVQLGQVFQNLLSNAIKFRGEQPPRVAVQARRFDDVFEFTIDDNGIGFQQEYADRIFQMFQRLHERQKYGGSGIGLALAKRVVERHGGTISVSSTPGVGSCFRFAIPVDLDGVRNTNLDPC